MTKFKENEIESIPFGAQSISNVLVINQRMEEK
jgi:hypothetical protein